MKMKNYREELHQELLKDEREYCAYCGHERHGFGCCGEVHYVKYRDMYPDDQKQFLQDELEEYEEWASKEAIK